MPLIGRFPYTPLVCLLMLSLAVSVIGCDSGRDRSFNRPNVATIDSRGHLLVNDFQNSRIVRFDSAGRYLGEFGRRGLGKGHLWRVWGLASLADGGVALVNHSRLDQEAEDQERAYHREVKVFGPDGTERFAFPALPTGEQETGWPEEIAVVPEGFVVSDGERDALLFFSPQGKYLRRLAEIKNGPPLVSPSTQRSLNGELWVTEYSMHRIRRITLDGEELLRVGQEGSLPGQFLFPETVDVSPEGWFVVADLGNYRLQRFDTNGRHLNSIVPEPARPGIRVQISDVDVGQDGLLYVVDSIGCRVLVYKKEGTLVRVLDRW